MKTLLKKLSDSATMSKTCADAIIHTWATMVVLKLLQVQSPWLEGAWIPICLAVAIAFLILIGCGISCGIAKCLCMWLDIEIKAENP